MGEPRHNLWMGEPRLKHIRVHVKSFSKQISQFFKAILTVFEKLDIFLKNVHFLVIFPMEYGLYQVCFTSNAKVCGQNKTNLGVVVYVIWNIYE